MQYLFDRKFIIAQAYVLVSVPQTVLSAEFSLVEALKELKPLVKKVIYLVLQH